MSWRRMSRVTFARSTTSGPGFPPPPTRRALGIGLSELEWTVNAYVLTFAVLLLSGGKLAARFGRRRVFVAGLAVFAASSLAYRLAPNGEILSAARAGP